jgi:glutamate carboxypeptidase
LSSLVGRLGLKLTLAILFVMLFLGMLHLQNHMHTYRLPLDGGDEQEARIKNETRTSQAIQQSVLDEPNSSRNRDSSTSITSYPPPFTNATRGEKRTKLMSKEGMVSSMIAVIRLFVVPGHAPGSSVARTPTPTPLFAPSTKQHVIRPDTLLVRPRAENELDRQLDDVVQEGMTTFCLPLYQQLVEQSSYSRDQQGVEAAQDILATALKDLGFSEARHASINGEFADHRVFVSPVLVDKPHAKAPLLVGHMDTVYPSDMGFTGFRREGDKVYGPGVADMKGGLSVIASALHAFRRMSPQQFSSELALRIVIVSDEEVGSPTSRLVLAELAPVTSVGLVFEPGRAEDLIITTRKGVGFFQVVAHGKAAHAGIHHEDGVNAIEALSRVVTKIAAHTNYVRGVTVNVGLISGGTAKNTVPDFASCDVDVRFVDGADAISFEPMLAKAAREAELAVPGSRIEVEGGISRPPLEASDASQSLRAQYEAGALASGLKIGEAPRQGGGSDANILSALGIPCIDGLGPFGQNFGEKTEWASLSSVERRTAALVRWLWLREGAARLAR